MSSSGQGEVYETAVRLVARAELHDAAVTALVSRAVDGTDGWLAGLDNRIKAVESLMRKLIDRLTQNPTRGVEALGSQVYDVLRYTVVSDEERYMGAHDLVLDGLRRQGVLVVRDASSWAGPGYRGINVQLRVGDWPFEVQFHTPASYEACKATRAYYEERRLAETSEARREELNAMTDAVFASVPAPPGVVS